LEERIAEIKRAAREPQEESLKILSRKTETKQKKDSFLSQSL